MSHSKSQKPVDLYVANFSYDVDEEDLAKLFRQYGKVLARQIWVDMETGQSRGYGFVTMSNKEEADRAAECLDGEIFRQRRLTVRVARPKKSTD